MGAIRYAMKDGRFVLADGYRMTGSDGVEEPDCSILLYNLLKKPPTFSISGLTAGIDFSKPVGTAQMRKRMYRPDRCLGIAAKRRKGAAPCRS